MKMSRVLQVFILICTISLTSCVTKNFRENRLQFGDYIFQGGYGNGTSWKESLIYTRTTWISGAEVYYDALIVPFSDKSPFWGWLSTDNRSEAQSECREFLISILYSATPILISHSQFINQMRQNGFSDFLIPELASAVKSHPDFRSLHMEDAKIMAFCAKKKRNEVGLNIGLPSFPNAHIKFAKGASVAQ